MNDTALKEIVVGVLDRAQSIGYYAQILDDAIHDINWCNQFEEFLHQQGHPVEQHVRIVSNMMHSRVIVNIHLSRRARARTQMIQQELASMLRPLTGIPQLNQVVQGIVSLHASQYEAALKFPSHDGDIQIPACSCISPRMPAFSAAFIEETNAHFAAIDQMCDVLDDTSYFLSASNSGFLRAFAELSEDLHKLSYFVARLQRVSEQQLDPDAHCPICKAVFFEGDEGAEEDVVRLPCHVEHVFHSSCVAKWLEKQQTCPLDRRVVLTM